MSGGPRPGVAGFLGLVPGLGHVYAGAAFRGLLLLAATPFAWHALATGKIAAAAYAFGHGLVAFDGYRIARKRRGDWTPEDAREARGVWIACAGALLLLGLAGAAGTPFSPWLAWPAILVPLGVGLALGERSNRADEKAAQAALEAEAAKKKEPEAASEPAPGNKIDRRADRADLAAQLVST